MKVSTIALLSGAGLGLAALAKRTPKRTAEIVNLDLGGDTPTIAMMRAPTPPPAFEGTWARRITNNRSAQRSQVCNPNTGNCFGVPLAMIFEEQLDTSAGGWISVRMWADTEYSPVREEHRPAASYWAWLGELRPGQRLTTIANNLPVQGSELPAMTWIQSTARINASGQLEISWRYPGKESTGIERGRRYNAMVSWRITSNKPT